MAEAQIMQKSPEQRAAHQTKVLRKNLNLNADQVSQINAAYLSQATRLDSLKNHLSADQKTNQLTRKTIMLNTKRQVLSVLDTTQQRQYLQMEEIRKQKQKARQPINRPTQG